MISVVICTHNRASSLVRALDSLARVNVPEGASWEVCVVDNASSDETRQVVEDFVARHGEVPVLYVYEPAAGLSHARNSGIAGTSGEIVAFLDDDVSVRGDWLVQLRQAFLEHEPGCVGGRAILTSDIPRPAWWHESYEGKVGHFDRGDRAFVSRSTGDGLVGIGANLAFRRDVFERHGLFRGELGRKGKQLSTGEEVDVVDRLRRSGEKAVYWPELVVYHYPHASRFTKAYLRRWFTGFGEWDYLREKAVWGDDVRILGVPRWRYRTAATDLVALIRGLLTGRTSNAARAEFSLRSFWGYFRAARRESPD